MEFILDFLKYSLFILGVLPTVLYLLICTQLLINSIFKKEDDSIFDTILAHLGLLVLFLLNIIVFQVNSIEGFLSIYAGLGIVLVVSILLPLSFSVGKRKTI